MEKSATRVFPLPYIPLDESIHLAAADDIGLDLADDTLLRTRQVKGQTPIEPTYGIADTWQEKPRRSGLAVTLHTEETELDKKSSSTFKRLRAASSPSFVTGKWICSMASA